MVCVVSENILTHKLAEEKCLKGQILKEQKDCKREFSKDNAIQWISHFIH